MTKLDLPPPRMSISCTVTVKPFGSTTLMLVVAAQALAPEPAKVSDPFGLVPERARIELARPHLRAAPLEDLQGVSTPPEGYVRRAWRPRSRMPLRSAASGESRAGSGSARAADAALNASDGIVFESWGRPTNFRGSESVRDKAESFRRISGVGSPHVREKDP
jgi:hypothetical protein